MRGDRKRGMGDDDAQAGCWDGQVARCDRGGRSRGGRNQPVISRTYLTGLGENQRTAASECRIWVSQNALLGESAENFLGVLNGVNIVLLATGGGRREDQRLYTSERQ